MDSRTSDPLATLDHIRLKKVLDCLGTYAFAIDVLPDGCFRCAAINRRLEDLAGSTGLIAGKQPSEWFPPPAGIELEARCQRCIDVRRHMSWQLELPLADRRLWWKVDLSPQADRTGHVVRVIGTATDITELKMHEAAREFSDARLEIAFDRMSEALALWDADDRLLLCNRPFTEFFPSHVLKHGVFRDAVMPYDAFAMTSAGHHGVRLSRNEQERWLRDGRCVLASEVPMPGGGVLEVRTDVTYRKRTERAVNQSRTILHAMLNALDELVVMINSDGVLLAINRSGAEMLGARPDRLIGRNLASTLDGISAQAIGNLLDGVLTAGEQRQGELTWRGRILDVTANPVLGEDGTPAAVSLVARDITEKREADEHAREHQRMLARCMRIATMGEMAAAIAHELSQPIAAASTFCHVSLASLEEGGRLTEDVVDAIAEVCREVNRAGAILNSVAGFVKRTPAERSLEEINLLVRAAADLARKELERQRVTLSLDLAEDLPSVMVNAVEIEQVVLNLMRNSIDALAAAKEPSLTVRTRLLDGQAVDVEVLDNGVGFPDEDLAKLFSPFFSSKPDGIGMGLAICRTIVEAHGGLIEAASVPEGGARVRFTLPLKEAGRVE